MTEEISSYFEKAKTQLKAEHDSMVEKIKEKHVRQYYKG